MGSGISDRLKTLEEFAEQVQKGAYIVPTALGPNKLSKASIKAKSITGSMIDVSNLQAVQTKTGSLTVDGALTVGTGGSLQSGKTAYSDITNAGYWIGLDSGIAKIRIGNVSHSAGLTWDGTSLAIKGTVTATSGTIGGWIIGTTDLTSDSGATGIASSGSTRLWVGNSTPTSAPFRVTSSGQMISTSGLIGPWTIDLLGIRGGTGATERGIDVGLTTFYSGGSPASAPFRVTSSGQLVASNANITGAITANSGVINNLSLAGPIVTGANIGAAIYSAGKTTYSSPTAGYWIGYDVDSQYKMNIGNTTKYLKWNGTTLTVSGRFEFGTGDYMENDLIHFEMSTGTGTTIEYKNNYPTNPYYSQMVGVVNATNTSNYLESRGPLTAGFTRTSSAYTFVTTTESGFVTSANHSGKTASFDINTTLGMSVRLSDLAGLSTFIVLDSVNAIKFGVTSNGQLIKNGTLDGTALGAYQGRWPVLVNGTVRYIGIYA